MQKLTACFWFGNNAEEALNYYISIFKDSKITSTLRNGPGTPFPEGSLLAGKFQVDGQEILVLNGNPQFNFNPSISIQINCNDQEEIDYYWEKLSEGGRTDQCGWLQDKFGISWQVIPSIWEELVTGKDTKKTQRAMEAMLQMEKLDISKLKQAYEQG